jgi:glycosyltransferase involved in cell wall biosynthesis
LEIIVVDDASEDNTQEVVKSFGDQRIRYIRHETNKRVATARNTGILNANGKYIAFLDDDDEWLPEKLKLQFDLLEGRSAIVGGVYTGSLAVEGLSRKVISKLTATKRGYIFDEMFIAGSIAPTSTFFFRKECFEKVGLFDVSLDYGEDFDMWLRIAKEFQIECIEEPLVRFMSPNNKPSLSANYDLIVRGREAYLRKYAALLSRDNKLHSYYYLNLGVFYCYNGNISNGRKAFIKAIKIYPFELRYYYNLCLSFLGTKNFKKLKMLRDQWLP